MSVTTTTELKGLQTRLAKAEAERKNVLTELEVLRQKELASFNEVEKLKTAIKDLKLSSAQPIITEHALLRYIERVEEIDIEAIKQTLLTPDVVALIQKFRSGKFPHELCQLVVKDYTIVTVEDKR